MSAVTAKLRAAAPGAKRTDQRLSRKKAASQAMRRLLVDHHRRHVSEKRGGQRQKHALDMALDHLARADKLPMIELHDTLEQLERLDERAGMVVHFRFFLGMSLAEVANELGISQKTVERDWSFARAWLRDRLKATEIS